MMMCSRCEFIIPNISKTSGRCDRAITTLYETVMNIHDVYASQPATGARDYVTRRANNSIRTTKAVPAMKPEATAIGDPQDGRWKITLMFDGRR